MNPTPAWFTPLLTRFAAACSSPSTGRTYSTHVDKFLRWGETQGWTQIGDLPPMAIHAWFEADRTGLKPMAPGTRNIAVGSIKAFCKWLVGESLPLHLDFPGTPKAPKKDKSTMKPKDYASPLTVVPANGVLHETSEPAPQQGTGFAPETGMPEPHSWASPSTSRSPLDPAPPVIDRTASVGVSPFDTGPTGSSGPFGSFSRPRVTQKRGVKNDPLAILCPPRGYIRVNRYCNGQMEFVSNYGPAAFEGCTDLTDFIHRTVLPKYGPNPGDKVVFKCTRFNEFGDAVSHEDVPIASPQGAQQQAPAEVINREILDGYVQAQARILADAEQKKNAAIETVAAAQKAGADPLAIVEAVKDHLKPDLAPMQQWAERISQSVAALSSAPARISPEAELMRTMMDRLLPPDGSPMIGRGGASSALGGLGTIKELATVARELREAFVGSTPVGVASGPNLEIASLRAEIASLRAEHSARPETPAEDDLERTVRKFKALKEVAAEFMGGEEGTGLASFLPDILGTVEKAIEAFAPAFNFRKAQTQGPAPAQGQGTSTASQGNRTGPGSPAPRVLPAPVLNTLSSLREVDVEAEDYAEQVCQLFLQAILALRADPQWTAIATSAENRFKTAEVRAQIHALVVDLFMACGLGKMLAEDPDLPNRTAEAIGDHYDEICAVIPGWTARKLIDQDPDVEDEEEPSTPAPVAEREAITMKPPQEPKAEVEAGAGAGAEAGASAEAEAPASVEALPKPRVKRSVRAAQ